MKISSILICFIYSRLSWFMTSLSTKMGRKCSHCGNIGHNSRTCPTHRRRNAGRMKLFGVQLLDPSSSPPPYCNHDKFSMKKSFSVDCLSISPFNAPSGSKTPACSTSPRDHMFLDKKSGKLSGGYLSDGLIQRSQEKKKGELNLLLCRFLNLSFLSNLLLCFNSFLYETQWNIFLFLVHISSYDKRNALIRWAKIHI